MLGYGIDHRSALLGERLLDARARPRAPRRRDGGPAARARLRGRPRADRGAQGAPASRSGARTWRPRCSPTRRTPSGSSAEGHARRLLVHPGVPDPGQAGLRGAHPSHGRGGDRLDPRRRRRGRLGASVLGHRRTTARCWRRSTATAAAGLDGVEVFYASHTREQTLLAGAALRGARAARAPARRTTTGPSTGCSAASAPSTCTAASPSSADRARHARRARARRRRASASGSPACRAPASPRSAGSPRASCATAATAWRCSTATTCARTSAPASASPARTAT